MTSPADGIVWPSILAVRDPRPAMRGQSVKRPEGLTVVGLHSTELAVAGISRTSRTDTSVRRRW